MTGRFILFSEWQEMYFLPAENLSEWKRSLLGGESISWARAKQTDKWLVSLKLAEY